MPAVTRQGDNTTGICDIGLPCCSHSRFGTNQVCSSDVFVNNKPLHRLQDSGPTNCPHGGTFVSVEGSSSVFVNGQAATRLGDKTVCAKCGQSGSHTVGSPNVFVNG